MLGPNGAGKTTTIRMLATLLEPDSGSARVLGHDIVAEADAVRALVSLTGQLASVDEDLTGRENLILLGRLLGLRRADAGARATELLDALGLADATGRLVKHFSGGMRRRLDIAASMVVTPQFMFLDEPTTGLDPRSRNQVWDIVRALVAGGTTIVLCTQYLEELSGARRRWSARCVRYVLAGTVIIVLRVVLGFRPQGGVSGVLAALALVIVFSFGLSCVHDVGLLLRTPNAVMNAGFMGIFPLTFLSNEGLQPARQRLRRDEHRHGAHEQYHADGTRVSPRSRSRCPRRPP